MFHTRTQNETWDSGGSALTRMDVWSWGTLQQFQTKWWRLACVESVWYGHLGRRWEENRRVSGGSVGCIGCLLIKAKLSSGVITKTHFRKANLTQLGGSWWQNRKKLFFWSELSLGTLSYEADVYWPFRYDRSSWILDLVLLGWHGRTLRVYPRSELPFQNVGVY